MREFNRVCLFCGASDDVAPAFLRAAREAGRLLADRGLGLVYGAGSVGLMGAAADGALEAGGEVIGVIPRKLLEWELAHSRLTRLEVVDTMHQRKARMADLADGFVALPGGFGTLEEVFEAITWTQLGYHHKPVGLLNVNGFYDQLLAFVDHAVSTGFIRAPHGSLLCAERDLPTLLDRLARVSLPTMDPTA